MPIILIPENQINNLSIIPSTDVIQLTLTLKMTTAQVVETSVTVNNNSPDDQTQPFEMFTKLRAKCSKIKQPSIILVKKQKLCKFLKPKEVPLFFGRGGGGGL